MLITMAGETSGSNRQQVFYDGFETFSGWITYGSGAVTQTTISPRSGSYCAIKTTADLGNGAYKALGFTLSGAWQFELWLQKYNTAGGGADRVYLVDGSFQGYGVGVQPTVSRIERFVPNSATVLTSISDTRTDNVWYRTVLKRSSNGVFTHYRYNSSGGLLSTSSVTDTTYNNFTQILITGGRDFLIDDISITLKDTV